jgi:hypothetical protein
MKANREYLLRKSSQTEIFWLKGQVKHSGVPHRLSLARIFDEMEGSRKVSQMTDAEESDESNDVGII